MGWSTYLNSQQYDIDEFRAEFDRIAAHRTGADGGGGRRIGGG